MLLLAAVLGAMASLPARADGGASSYVRPLTGNTTAASNWRFAPGQLFEGVAALDASARLNFKSREGGGNYRCSGSLLAGGAYILTAGHCGDDIAGGMTIEFQVRDGVAAVTRTATAADVTLHPLWQGFDTSADAGSDLALIKLSAPVTTIAGYHLSTSNDLGKQMLIAGYGTTGIGGNTGSPRWEDDDWGHYAFNTADVDSKSFNLRLNDYVSDWGAEPGDFTGTTYMYDFDDAANPDSRNTLQRLADATGQAWASGGAIAGEGLTAGGDSGGGDLVWNGREWLLSAVHSWGWQGNEIDGTGACDFLGLSACSPRRNNDSSYGDLSGSTAVFDQLAWIRSVVGEQVVAVPEPASAALWLLGLGGLGGLAGLRARRSRARG